MFSTHFSFGYFSEFQPASCLVLGRLLSQSWILFPSYFYLNTIHLHRQTLVQLLFTSPRCHTLLRSAFLHATWALKTDSSHSQCPSEFLYLSCAHSHSPVSWWHWCSWHLASHVPTKDVSVTQHAPHLTLSVTMLILLQTELQINWQSQSMGVELESRKIHYSKMFMSWILPLNPNELRKYFSLCTWFLESLQYSFSILSIRFIFLTFSELRTSVWDGWKKLQTPSGHRAGIISIIPFLDAAQDIGLDDTISALFLFSLQNKLPAGFLFMRVAIALYKFPIRILTVASLCSGRECLYHWCWARLQNKSAIAYVYRDTLPQNCTVWFVFETWFNPVIISEGRSLSLSNYGVPAY